MRPTPSEIAAAYDRIESWVRRTPTMAYEVAAPAGTHHVTLKLELLQHSGSFKARGAFTSVLSAASTPARLVAASGGNHGLAVAYVGQQLGIDATIFVPETAPAAKVSRLHSYGADVRQVGTSYAEAFDASKAAATADGVLAIHAYDQPATVAGQGTLGLELDEQCDPDTVLVACGGGGLVGGVASWFGTRTKIIAVEPDRCPTYAAALTAGQPTMITPGGVASDSLGASQLGAIAWQACRAAGVESLLVSGDEITAARDHLWQTTRLAAEPGGVTALAPLLSGAYVPADGERVAVIICGSNADPATLALN